MPRRGDILGGPELMAHFIDLTQRNGTRVSLNMDYVVAIQPDSRGGGSLLRLVPHLEDMTVRETPENIRSMLDGR